MPLTEQDRANAMVAAIADTIMLDLIEHIDDPLLSQMVHNALMRAACAGCVRGLQKSLEVLT